MSSIFIFCHFTGKIEGKIEDGEIRGLKQMDTMGNIPLNHDNQRVKVS